MTGRLQGSRRWLWLMAPQRIPSPAGGVDSPSALDLSGEEIWLEGSGRVRLHAWFIPAPQSSPAIVVLHGWGGSAALMLPLAPGLHRAGYHALFVDARNHGLSDRRRVVSMPRFADDLDVAVAWLRSRPEVTAVGVIGHSVGAGAAILSASRTDPPDAVVSVAAPADPGALMREQMSGLPRPVRAAALGAIQRVIGQKFEDFAPRNRIGGVLAPVMLVHGAEDRVVPIDNLYHLQAARPDAEVLVVADAGHSDLERFLPHLEAITDFFGRHLAG